MLLEKKVVVVTGAGMGVGAAIAKMAAQHGAHVVVNDAGVTATGEGRDPTVAQGVVDEIIARGGVAIASVRDVSDWDDAHGIIKDAVDAFGRVDVVVNNAGIVRDNMFHKMTKEEFDFVDNVNLRGVFYVSRAAAPHFRSQNGGCYVHMTSTSGLIGNVGQVNYGAAKMGVAGMSKCIAFDMQRYGVTSNAIAPAAWTRMISNIAETPDNAKALEMMRRMTPEKIAPLVIALASDRGRRTTGQIFGVRNNEIFLYSQPRPIRTAHTSDGWTPETVLDRVLGPFEPSYFRLERSPEIFSWEPV